MARSGSFGPNSKRVWNVSDYPNLPAKVGDLGSDTDGEYMFVRASAAVAQYAFVLITDTFTAAETSGGSTIVQHVGVAQVAAAINEYLWVWIGGPAGGGVGKGIRGKIAASYVANTPLLTTAAAGVADDAGSTTIKNVSATTLTTGAASVELKSTGYLTLN
jgi:hypothetical protein